MVILKSADKVSIAQIEEEMKELYHPMSRSRSVIKSMYSSEQFPQTWERLKTIDMLQIIKEQKLKPEEDEKLISNAF